MPEVKVGQKWADNDKRAAGRVVQVVEVRDGFAFCNVVAMAPSARPSKVKKTRIKLERFRSNTRGYRLLPDQQA